MMESNVLERSLEEIVENEDLVIFTPNIIGSEKGVNLLGILYPAKNPCGITGKTKDVLIKETYYYIFLKNLVKSNKNIITVPEVINQFRDIGSIIKEKFGLIGKTERNEEVLNQLNNEEILKILYSNIHHTSYFLSQRIKYDKRYIHGALFQSVVMLRNLISKKEKNRKYPYTIEHIITTALYNEIVNKKNPAIISNSKYFTTLFTIIHRLFLSSDLELYNSFQRIREHNIKIYSSVESDVYKLFRESKNIYGADPFSVTKNKKKNKNVLERMKGMLHEAERHYDQELHSLRSSYS